MGVPVTKKRNKGKKPASSRHTLRQMTGAEFFVEAEMAYFADNLHAARAGFQKALDIEPENVEFLDGYGAFLAECGPRSEAITVLQRACGLQPDAGFEKFMYLGQVLDAENRSTQAEAAVRQGVGILRQDVAALQSDGQEEAAPEAQAEADHLRQALSSALCSLAELLMSAAADDADEADGEGGAEAALANSPALHECEELLGEARQLSSASAEPLQVMCSLRRLQGRDDEALGLLRQSMQCWFHPDPSEEGDSDASMGEEEERLQKAEAAAAGNGTGSQGGASSSSDEERSLPSYEFRFESAKLLLELDETTEAAAAVLEGLVEENDSVPEVWLLLAVAHRAGGRLEEAGEVAAEGWALAKKLGLPASHEVATALAELAQELSTLGGDGEQGL